MANPRSALLKASRHLNSECKLLDLVLPEGESLNFTGGQYIIVNTNIPLPGGKIAKRAYSILSGDSDQNRFQIAVKKLGSGPGSNYMHETGEGASLPFSGPWGQFLPDDTTSGDSTLVLATDTGITAALGLVQGMKFISRVHSPRIIWFTESKDYFIPESFAAKLVRPDWTGIRIEIIPPANHPDRLPAAAKLFETLLNGERLKSAFLSGDGALLHPFRDRLINHGTEENQIKIECFFNNPFKKIQS